jgi:hypothetical protein
MKPNDVIEGTPVVAKQAAVGTPFTATAKQMLGPAADELAEMWKDQVRTYRYERQRECVEKAEGMVQEAGFTPQAVPLKVLFPLLEGASLEENEALHTMWAALLANAVSPDNLEKVRTGFVATLKTLSWDEVLLLNWIYDRVLEVEMPFSETFTHTELLNAYATVGRLSLPPAGKIEDAFSFETCLDGLDAARLIDRVGVPPEREARDYVIGHLGFQFVSVCRPPKPKS